MTGRRTAFLATAALLLASAAEGTNGAKPMAYSPAAAGRGGADIALSEDSTAINLNPAGIADMPGNRGDLYLSILTARTFYANAWNDDETPLRPGFVPTLGAVFRPPRAAEVEFACPRCGALVGAEAIECPACGLALAPEVPPGTGGNESPWRFGFGVFGQTGGGGTTRYKTRLHPEGIQNQTQFVVASVAPAVAYRAGPRLSVGGALHLLYAMFETEGPVSSRGGDEVAGGKAIAYWDVADDPKPISPTDSGQRFADVLKLAPTNQKGGSSVDVKVNGAQGMGLGAVLGAIWRPTGRLTLGLSYTTPSFMTPIDGTAEVKAAKALDDLIAKGGVIENYFRSYLPNWGRNGFGSRYKFRIENFTLPQQLGLGAAYRPGRRWRLSTDLKWIDWSSALDTIRVRLSEGSNEDINALVGSREIRTQMKFLWRDQLVVASGVEYFAGRRLVLRTGYNWGENPAPRKTLGVTGGAIAEHHVTAGLGYRTTWGQVDFAWYHAFQKSITIGDNENPDAVDTRIKQFQNVFYLGSSWLW